MHTPVEVEVLIGGKAQRGWTHYDIDSDLFIPADAYRVGLSKTRMVLPPEVKDGATVEVRLVREGASTTVLSGRLDDRALDVHKNGQDLQLSGRDGAGVLVDCSTPILSMRQLSLGDVVAKIVRSLGVTRIRIDAENEILREKVNLEPGDTAWDSLRRAAEANGLWPWFDPDGTLVVGRPRYDLPPVATLVLNNDGKGNNVERLLEHRSISERYSEVTVLGQAHAGGTGSGERSGRNSVRAKVRDDGMTVYRPKVVVDHEAISEEVARARGRKIISDARLRGYTLTATVLGHYTEDGVAWMPGQRIAVKSEPHGIDGVYFLTGRRFSSNKRIGTTTVLTMKEDGVWLLDAHPSNRKHRRGKNSLPGKVVDLTGGAA
jgi:prophage tail gpP-like protein